MTVQGVFANSTERRQVAAGEVLFAEGDSGQHMFGVLSGSFELRRGHTVVASVGPGETFGEMSIIDDAVRTLTAVATEPSEVAAIDRRAFLFLVHETPTFAIQVMRSLAARVRDHDNQI